MANESIQARVEDNFMIICESWQNCNEANVQSFLAECYEQSIDPQFCMNWLEQNKDQLPNWSSLSIIAQEWVNEHTSTGSPLSMDNQS
ncbi:hypothetical protein [Alkalihalobacterium chitinilyticum]|uniref:Uncharacterized protein n=1 Tax=Alkalihalobacterium chitinilyticum TaxID=2980103 RepID=A0ABT5VD75_9BACI|nr:hypothetical protein [Alkalihalobacterium chitinilyticum]MDE5413405.1 hypothetical protein [Alkalihalobacterium chitinilyticum]